MQLSLEICCVEFEDLLLQVIISFFQYSEFGLEVVVSWDVFFYIGYVLFESLGSGFVFNVF